MPRSPHLPGPPPDAAIKAMIDRELPTQPVRVWRQPVRRFTWVGGAATFAAVMYLGFQLGVEQVPVLDTLKSAALVALCLLLMYAIARRTGALAPRAKAMAGDVWLFPAGVVVTSGADIVAVFDLRSDLVRVSRTPNSDRGTQIAVAISHDGVVFHRISVPEIDDFAAALGAASTRCKREQVLAHLRAGGEFDARGLVLDATGVRRGSTHLAYAELHYLQVKEDQCVLDLRTPYDIVRLRLADVLETDLVIDLLLTLAPQLRG